MKMKVKYHVTYKLDEKFQDCYIEVEYDDYFEVLKVVKEKLYEKLGRGDFMIIAFWIAG